MIIHETCTCGASLRVEDDKAKAARDQIKAWRQAHRCGISPWNASTHSSTASQVEFGFRPEVPRRGEREWE